jgi:hypothetical protein
MRVGLSWLRILGDLVRFLCLGLRSRTSLAAENLFLRKQLAFYQERKVKPRRADNPTRVTLVPISRWFNWRDALIVVRPGTLVTWHRKGFRLFWRWKSEAGRGPIPVALQHLIRKMARENPTWGEEGIANELLLKLGLWIAATGGVKFAKNEAGDKIADGTLPDTIDHYPCACPVASHNLVHVILRACGFEESRCDAADLASALRLKVHWRVRSMSGLAPYHA